MKLLTKIVIKTGLTSPCAYLCVPLSLLLCLSVSVQAQTEKQISYQVAIPLEHAASSAAPAPVPAAPAPVIRPVDQASSVPPSVKKSAAKKIPVADVDDEKVKKAAKKATSTSHKTEPAKKSEAVKSTKQMVASPMKASAKPVSTPAKPLNKPGAPTSGVEKKTAQNPEAEKIAPVVMQVPFVATAAAAVPPKAVLAAKGDDEDFSAAENQALPAINETATPAPIISTPASPALATGKMPLPMSNDREAFVNNFKDYVETKIVPQVPGLAVAIVSEGKVKFIQGYGIRKAGSRDPVTPDTVFRLASLSKSFAATAAAMLVRDNLLSWDAPLTSILPNVEFSNPRYGAQLTIENILSQSSGLPTQTNTNFIEDGQSFDEVIGRLRNVSFICPPGKCYNYQNVTYSLIGPVIQKKTGKTYEKFVEDNIFTPLGMYSASFGTAGFRSTNNYALPHLGTRHGWAPAEVTENYYRLGPAAGINASITDMTRWMLAHMGHNPDVLQPSLLDKVHSKVTRNTPAQNHYGSREGVTDSHYGLGWRVFDYRGDKNFVHHGGGVLGFRSEMVYNPELQIGMVVLTNTQRLAGDIIFEFLDDYEDQKRGPRKVFKAAPAQVQAPVKKKKSK